MKWVRLTGVIVAIDQYGLDRRVTSVHEGKAAKDKQNATRKEAEGKPGRWIATLDDSSGACVEIVCSILSSLEDEEGAKIHDQSLDKKESIADTAATPAPRRLISSDVPDLEVTDIDVGTVVLVNGGVTSFRDMKQLYLRSFSVLGSTNDEVEAWRERIAFKKNVLDQPWIVTEEQEKTCLKRSEQMMAERLQRQQEAEAAEKKAKAKAIRREIRRKEKEREAERREELAVSEASRRPQKSKRPLDGKKSHTVGMAEGSRKSGFRKKAKESVSLSREAILRVPGKYDASGIS